jgi:hypothetical protein
MNIREKIEDFRDDTGLYDVGDFPDNEVIKLLNRAGRELCDLDAFVIERQYSWAKVANQSRYSLPDDFFGLKKLIVDGDDVVEKGSVDYIKGLQAGYGAEGTPFMWGIWRDKLWLHYIPGSAAETTTLVGNHTTASTSFTVVTPSDGIPNRGVVQIDSEIAYYEKTEVSGSNTILSVLERGKEDTVSASHSDGATVTFLTIEMDYWARFRKNLKVPETGQGEEASGGSSLTAGRHYLMWTYYDNSRGLESYPKDLLSLSPSSGEKISLSNLIDAPDLETFQKRIYMTKAAETQPYYLVTTLSSGTTTYDIDIADSNLHTEFDWDDVGGDNMPNELCRAQVDWAIYRWLWRSKRFGESREYKQAALDAFLTGKRAIARRRTANVHEMRPDIVM